MIRSSCSINGLHLPDRLSRWLFLFAVRLRVVPSGFRPVSLQLLLVSNNFDGYSNRVWFLRLGRVVSGYHDIWSDLGLKTYPVVFGLVWNVWDLTTSSRSRILSRLVSYSCSLISSLRWQAPIKLKTSSPGMSVVTFYFSFLWRLRAEQPFLIDSVKDFCQ